MHDEGLLHHSIRLFRREVLKLLRFSHHVVRDLFETVSRRKIRAGASQLGASLRHTAQISNDISEHRIHTASFGAGEREQPYNRRAAVTFVFLGQTIDNPRQPISRRRGVDWVANQSSV